MYGMDCGGNAAYEPSESNLAAIALDKDLKVILVTAANTGSGVSSCALTLASELATANRERVLLLDACTTDSGLTHSLELADKQGFMELLSQPDQLLEDYVHSPPSLPFDVMPLGKKGGFDLNALPELFATLCDYYRFVIIDGDAIYASSTLASIAAQVDGVVLVVRAEETRWEVAQAAVHRLRQADARLIGSIFNARRYYMPKWIYDNL